METLVGGGLCFAQLLYDDVFLLALMDVCKGQVAGQNLVLGCN